jgi:hypothetical protein
MPTPHRSLPPNLEGQFARSREHGAVTGVALQAALDELGWTKQLQDNLDRMGLFPRAYLQPSCANVYRKNGGIGEWGGCCVCARLASHARTHASTHARIQTHTRAASHAHGPGGISSVQATIGRTLELMITLTADGKDGRLAFTMHTIGYYGRQIGEATVLPLPSGCICLFDQIADGTARVRQAAH